MCRVLFIGGIPGVDTFALSAPMNKVALNRHFLPLLLKDRLKQHGRFSPIGP